MGAFWQDLHYAVRVLRKSPGLTLTAVVSLALGIGGNTAVFSVVHATLLRALPYPEPDRLVRVAQRSTQDAVSIPEFEFWKAHAPAFASAAGYRGVVDRSLASDGRHEWIRVLTVTSDFFGTLGVRPALGREFRVEETRHGGPQAIVVSDGLWRRAFGGDAGVLGRPVRLGDENYTVVGVLPRGFWFPQAADAFVPLQPAGGSGDRGRNTEMIARLKPGWICGRPRRGWPR
jgi:putative ABC transport system permease protein